MSKYNTDEQIAEVADAIVPKPADRIAEMRERVEAATDGPWSPAVSNPDCEVVTVPAFSVEGEQVCVGRDGNDMWFIAHSITDIPWLLEQVERLENRLNDVRSEMDVSVDSARIQYERAEAAEAYLESNQAAWIEGHRITAGYAEREITLTARAEAAEKAINEIRSGKRTPHAAINAYDKARTTTD